MTWESLFQELMLPDGNRRMSIKNIVAKLPTLQPQRQKAKLMNFIIEATGVSKSALLREEDLRNFQNSKEEILQSIQDMAKQNEPRTFPVLNKVFCARFCQFLQDFVMKSGEPFFAPNNGALDLVDFFEMLLLSDFMPQRRTGVLACMKVITAGARIGFITLERIDALKSQNSLDGTARFSTCSLENLQNNFQNVKSTLKELCKQISLRYRDANAVIRKMCLKETEIWCENLLSVVGLQAFQRSLANRLIDTNKSVRRQALQVAFALFRHRDTHPLAMYEKVKKLFHVIHEQLFISTLDEDVDISCIGIKAFVEAIKYFDDCEPLYADKCLVLIYSKHARTGAAAGTILKLYIERRTKDPEERLRKLIKFSAQRPGGESCVIYALAESASSEWFHDMFKFTRELLEGPMLVNERRSLIVLLGFLVRKWATNEVPRQRVSEKDVLKNLLPLPRPNDCLEPLPQAFVDEYPYILRLCAHEDSDTCIYLVRLLQYITYDDTSNEREQEILFNWLKEAFEESDDVGLLDEISRALATLLRRGSTKADVQSMLDEISMRSVDQLRSLLGVVYSERLSNEDRSAQLISRMKKVSTLLTHGFLSDMDGMLYIPDTCDLLRDLNCHEYPTTRNRLLLMESSLQILHRHLTMQYNAIPRDVWEFFEESPELAEIQSNFKSCVALGCSIIVRKEDAVGRLIYPIVCDVLVSMSSIEGDVVTENDFIRTSEHVLERNVFKRDKEGNYDQELFKSGHKILCKLLGVVKIGVIEIDQIPPVFHLYDKCSNTYDEALQSMVEAKTSLDNEPECLVALLRSVEQDYKENGIASSREVAMKLAQLFGRPTRQKTVRVFYEILLEICLSINRSQWNTVLTEFALGVTQSFIEIVKLLSLEELSNCLLLKTPVSGDSDTETYYQKYFDIIEETRKGVTGFKRRSDVNTSPEVPARRRRANGGDKERQSKGTQNSGSGSHSGSDSQERSPSSRLRNRRRTVNRRSSDDGSGSGSKERSPSSRPRNQRRTVNRRSSDDGLGSGSVERSPSSRPRNRRRTVNRRSSDDGSGS